MNIVDIVIVIFIFLGGVVGYKRGVVKEFFKAIGFIVISVLSFLFKKSFICSFL